MTSNSDKQPQKKNAVQTMWHPSYKLHSGYNHSLLRKWQCADSQYQIDQLVFPVFVLDIKGQKKRIPAMPGQYQWSVDRLHELLDPLVERGLSSILLFGTLTDNSLKTPTGSLADTDGAPVIQAIRYCKSKYPKLYVIADVCMCQYTDHGHCGIFHDIPSSDTRQQQSEEDETASKIETVKDLHNDDSVVRLGEIAAAYARAGADMVAPSDMMDGRIMQIKKELHRNDLERKVGVMAYSAKFASCFYGPFRDAANSAPEFGDRSTYQLPPGACSLGKRALHRDADEGADILMVKPAMMYLDMVKYAAENTHLPVACYQVSGEYAMLWHAAKAGSFSLSRAVNESFCAMRRSGCTIIISYFTPFILYDWKAEEVPFLEADHKFSM